MAAAQRPRDLQPPPAGELVELRVHGVGGATPEELLDVPLTELVAGDESAGFFRPWRKLDDGPAAVEGYTWGGLTSAARLRALWVLLIPFALANLSGWMLRHGGEPTDTTRRRRLLTEGLGVALARMYGVVLTVAVTAYLTVAGFDLVGYQCGAHPTCAGGRWWLSPWESGLVGGAAGRSVVVGAMIPLVAVLGLAWLARRSQLAIQRGSRRQRFRGSSDPALSVNLRHDELWDSPHVAHRLGLTHAAAALAAIAVTAASVADHASDSGATSLTVTGWVLLAATVVAVARLEGVPAGIHAGLFLGAAAHLALALIALWNHGALEAASGSLPGGGVVAGVLLPVYPLVALATGLLAVTLWRRNATGGLRTALMPPVLLLVAAGVVNAFGSGLLIRLADLLGTPVVASDHPVPEAMSQPPVVYADAAADASVVTVFALLVTALVAVVMLLRSGEEPSCDDLAERYSGRGGLDCDDPDDQDWAKRVGRAERVATLTDQVAIALATVTLIVVTAVAIITLLAADEGGMGLGGWADRLARPASVVLSAIPVLAVIAISRLYRSHRLRRVVGILWDVATFWPRWFHPWSPPPYGERAVPQLDRRLTFLASGGEVIISGHSQGSVIALAALLRLDPSVLTRVAVVTHGSPLTRLYAHYFPEYFAPDLYGQVAGKVAGWINLWRLTDFIGGRLDAAPVADREVFDPPSTRSPIPGEARPVPARHSDYDRTDEYRRAVEELAARLSSRQGR